MQIHQVINWTPELIASLRKLWASGLSATKCAEQLFTPDQRKRLSSKGRNAVMGQVHRLGLVKPVPKEKLARRAAR